MKTTLFAILFLLLFASFSIAPLAKINFNKTDQDKIHLNQIVIEKSAFFSFLASTIQEKPPGLGKYGRVPFSSCDLPYNGKALIHYKTLRGIENRFLSNPTCNQIVIQNILENNYKYTPRTLSSYGNRKCVLTLEKIFSPMLEYYTIKYEERQKTNCKYCDNKERNRLEKILRIRESLKRNCGRESEKTLRFLTDLDETIEKSFQRKSSKN